MGSPPRYEWTDNMLEVLCMLKSRNNSNFKIARAISNRFKLIISEAMVADCWNKLIDYGYFEDKPEYNKIVAKTIKNRDRKLTNSSLHCPRAASIWHLIDLKRAGHSPTKTELKIESDFWPKRLPTHNEISSYCGSSSNLCAMEG